VHEVAYGPDPAQRFDIHLPRQPKGAPTIFYVHGGGWRRGDKAMRGLIEAKQKRWTAAGAVVISANYRMLPDTDPLEQARDIARAVAKAQDTVAVARRRSRRLRADGTFRRRAPDRATRGIAER
jgi:arylformamidase